MYDVIIIGAGPTGSTAAKILSENGYKVLLAEKFKMPRYKSCSGQLISKTISLVHTYFEESVPDYVMCTPTENRGMIFTNDKGKEFCFEQKGLNVWRSSFDNWLTEKAAEKGVEIRECTSALSCEENDGTVTVTFKGKNIYTEKAKYVIDYEGVVGTLERKIKKYTPQYITTFQTFNKGNIYLDYHYFYAYLQPKLSEYDAWFNVKDDFIVLGVAVKDVSKIKYFYNQFINYMQEKHHLQLDEQLKTEKWLMPYIQPGCAIDYGIGRILFAGEIAGFLNPMGEGISAGMESGYCAAKSIIQHFNNLNLIYDTYKNTAGTLQNYMKRQWNFVARMSDTFKEMKL